MLYVTTRDHKDAYTVHKTYLSDTAADGGVFVPFRLPVYSQEDIGDLVSKGANEIIADVLNRFFGTKLTPWAVDLAIGRNTLKLYSLSQKILIAEPWHNPTENYTFAQQNLYKLLSDAKDISIHPTRWVKIAIKIAFIFAVYGSLRSTDMIEQDASFDIAVNTTDFVDPIAAWYAKEMGLPINTILCSCTGDDAVWDLIHRGQISTNSIGDALNQGVEQLVYAAYGLGESIRYVNASASKKTFTLDFEILKPLSDTFFCAMMSQNRADTVSNSVVRTDSYQLCSTGALAYGAVQDYRAKTGENKVTLLFSNQSAK